MEENVPIQDQSLSILLVCPKIILCRIREKSDPDFFAPVGGWKKAFKAAKFSHLPSLPQLRKTSRAHQPVRSISKTWLYALIPFLFSLFMLCRLFRKYSSENFFITPLHSLCWVTSLLSWSISLDYVLERSWAGFGFRVSTALLRPEEGLTVLSHIDQKHTSPKVLRRKEKAIVTACVLVCHGNTPLPRSRGNTKGFCVIFLCLPVDSSECWIQIHSTRVEIFHCSQAALHCYTKIIDAFVRLLSFTVLHLDLS